MKNQWKFPSYTFPSTRCKIFKFIFPKQLQMVYQYRCTREPSTEFGVVSGAYEDIMFSGTNFIRRWKSIAFAEVIREWNSILKIQNYLIESRLLLSENNTLPKWQHIIREPNSSSWTVATMLVWSIVVNIFLIMCQHFWIVDILTIFDVIFSMWRRAIKNFYTHKTWEDERQNIYSDCTHIFLHLNLRFILCPYFILNNIFLYLYIS